MTLILTPETEAQLTVIAAQRGLPPEKALIQMVADEAQRVAEEADIADAVAGLLRGSAEIAAGDWVSLETYRAEVPERRRM